MVGDGFQIDLAAMNRLVDTLRAAAKAITAANQALADAPVRQLGSDFLDQAGGEFADRWHYGTDKIADLTGAMTDALAATTNAYAELEQQLAQAFASGAGA